MALSEVTQTITDGALGIVPEAIDGITAKIGICSVGTPATFYSFGDIPTLKATLGVGPLVEAAAHLLAISGGPVYCVPATIATAGSCGSVTKSGAGPNIAAAGAAYDRFDAIVKIIAGGALGAGTFQYSMDGGDNYSPTIVLPGGATYLIPDSNVTLTFTAGTFVAGDTYTFTTTAPLYDSTTLTAALTALFADPREFRFLHVVGQATSVANAASLAATIDTALTSAANSYRYVRAFMEAPTDTDANLISGFAAFQSGRVCVCTDFAEVVSSISGRIYKRSSAWPVTARAAKVPVHEDLGRFASGSLQGVGKIYRDERTTPGLDAQRFTTLRTFVGQGSAAYITAGRTMAATTSDYQLVQNGFVMDKACRLARNALLTYLNESLRVDQVTGYILEQDAQKIEADVTSQLNAGLVAQGNASSVSVKVNRQSNILSTQTLPVQIRIVPKGYARFITTDIGLFNPALQPV